MVNIVSPLRVGELVRVYALADRLTLSKTYVLATLAVEKALDMLLFGASVMLLIAVAAIPAGVDLRLGGRLMAAVVAFAALWMIARFAATLAPRLERVLPWLPERWMARGRETLDRFVEGLSAIRQPRTGAWLIALSAAVLLSSALTNYLLMRAFAFNVPAWTALFLLVLHQIGFVPPSLPGKLGIFNYLTVLGLVAFGVDRPAAFSFSLVLYAVSYLPKVMLGAAYAWLGSVRLTPR
jgi:hypothetical protein